MAIRTTRTSRTTANRSPWDVSEGKTDPLYRAHSYHTKVPHRAIVPSILHYTRPGDLILGRLLRQRMTGVAAQWCETPPSQYRAEIETRWQEQGRPAPEWGPRHTILGDLSPAATFIAANYTTPFDGDAFDRAGRRLLDDVGTEIGWMYDTLHADSGTAGADQLHRMERGVLLPGVRGRGRVPAGGARPGEHAHPQSVPLPALRGAVVEGQSAALLHHPLRPGVGRALETHSASTQC